MVWQALSGIILIFTIVYFSKVGIRAFVLYKSRKQKEKQIKADERRKTLQKKILNMVRVSQASTYIICETLKPLGFSREEIEQEMSELISEGKIQQIYNT